MSQRRDFVKAGLAFTALSYGRIQGANDRIRLAGLGTGGRGTFLLTLATKAEKTELVAVCDAYEPRRAAAREKLAPAAKEYLDYREVLERRDIDAVVVGSPDHWHVPMTIDAVQAGKDVYVEKPISHSIEAGERVEKAVTASKQIVQVGYQQRSWDHFLAAREIVAGGKLGRITLVLTSWYQDYLINMRTKPVVDVSKLDWKRFLGSAPAQPFDALRFTRWRWFWDFGNGHLTDLYSHYGDVVQWFMNDMAPRSAMAMGGAWAIPEFECPDTINTVWEYQGFNIVYNGALNGSLDGGNIIFRGSRALMKLNRDGFAVYTEGVVKRELTEWPTPETAVRSTGDGTVSHMQNFLDCVRSRKAPNAGIVTSVAIARAAHLGNQSYRKGAKVTA
jgi:predicted dehydrogenase